MFGQNKKKGVVDISPSTPPCGIDSTHRRAETRGRLARLAAGRRVVAREPRVKFWQIVTCAYAVPSCRGRDDARCRRRRRDCVRRRLSHVRVPRLLERRRRRADQRFTIDKRPCYRVASTPRRRVDAANTRAGDRPAVGGTWPAWLEHHLEESGDFAPDHFQVLNLGLSGATAQDGTNKPFRSQSEYQELLASGFDLAIVTLGTNDAKAAYPRPRRDPPSRTTRLHGIS